jgi:hypothetical protein
MMDDGLFLLITIGPSFFANRGARQHNNEQHKDHLGHNKNGVGIQTSRRALGPTSQVYHNNK